MTNIVSVHIGGPALAKALGIDPDGIQRIIIDADVAKGYVVAYVKKAVCDEEMCAVCDLIKQWRENGLPAE